MTRALSTDVQASLKAVDTPTICNAIELIEGRRKGTGFTRSPVICPDPMLPPMLGFAMTARIRADRPASDPADVVRLRRLNYYRYLATETRPRLVVIEDHGDERGIGAFWGEVNVAIHKGLGLQGVLTNGSIRDLGAIDPGFQLLAGSVGPSHAFVHVTGFDAPVRVFGLAISPGDLIHADRHGAVIIEPGVEKELPRAIDLVTRKEAPILKAARAEGFTIDRLLAAWGEADDIH
ncbi:MAG: RraA family protein [Hyphomicrobiales bacterium]|jgi:regulator of RNase E activity RraA|nr:RraA family protein [Hyphomicrobiales bacterium]